MKTLLVVTKDVRPGMIARSVAEALMTSGWRVIVCASGLSLGEWDSAGIEVLVRGPMGSEATSIFERVKPDALLSGLSSPIDDEELCIAEARRRGVPVVAIDDNWGAYTRSSTPADLYLTIDNLGRKLIEKDERYRGSEVWVMGDIAGRLPSMPREAENFLKALRQYVGPLVVLALPKHPNGRDLVDITLQSLVISRSRGKRFSLLPRIHPGASVETKRIWEEMIDSFSSRLHGQLFWLQDTPQSGEWSTDYICTLADITVGTVGSGLRVAAYNRRIPVCVKTPRLADLISRDCGAPTHPLVLIGAALSMERPCDLLAKVEEEADGIRMAQEKFLQPVPFHPEAVAEALRSFVGVYHR